jgi:hypothetical protein
MSLDRTITTGKSACRFRSAKAVNNPALPAPSTTIFFTIRSMPEDV